MSVVVWDGKIIAADCQAVYGDTVSTIRKIFLLENGEVVGVTGALDAAATVIRWYKQGADPEKWPEIQKTDNWARIIVASKNRICFAEKTPDFVDVVDSFAAWGCGREAALGALEMGADAIKAVEVASKWINGCGRGCDSFRVRD